MKALENLLENKVPPPLVAIVCAVCMWGLASLLPVLALSPTLRMVAVGVFVLLGLLFALAGILSFRRANTTVNPLQPETASTLVTSGVYRFTRNPMYLGFVWLLCAWASYLGSVWAAVFILLYVFYMQRFQIKPEERALLKIFGEAFSQYKLQVRTWL